MSGKTWVKVLIIAAVVLFSACIYFWLRVLVPVNPASSYFPEKAAERMGFVRWSLRSFQPVYLYTFNKGEFPYLKVAYRGPKNGIRFANVRLGQLVEGKLKLASIRTTGDFLIEASSSADYKNNLVFGDRVRVVYLMNVTKGSGEFSEAIPPTDPGAEEFCTMLPYICEAYKVTKPNQEIYRNIEVNKILPKNLDFLGLLINLVLAE